MHTLRMTAMAGAALVAVSALAGAQRRPTSIPAGFQPPAGMCRVWYEGVAPGRQPAPTDCATARARLTSNSFLVYGQGTAQQQQGNGRWGSVPTNGQDTRGTWGNGRDNGQYDGRYDRMSDKERREWEKAHRKAQKEREKEWKRAHKRGDQDDRDDDDREDRRRDQRDQRDPRDRNGTITRPGSTTGGWGARIPRP